MCLHVLTIVEVGTCMCSLHVLTKVVLRMWWVCVYDSICTLYIQLVFLS